MQTTNQLRENIAKCLNNKHMTQSQLSALSGVHESTISRILSGKREILYAHLCARFLYIQYTNELRMVTRGGRGCRRLRGWRVFDGFESYAGK